MGEVELQGLAGSRVNRNSSFKRGRDRE
nr:hypothetical protein [Tanacetum cinerariifolium]